MGASKFTGSFGHELNTIDGNIPDYITIHTGSLEENNYEKLGADDWLIEITHSLVRGFYSGSVDEYGILDSNHNSCSYPSKLLINSCICFETCMDVFT